MLKPIPNFPDYFADELGNVYSQKPKNQNSPRPTVPRQMKKRSRGGYGYNFVALRRDGKIYQINTGIIILTTFVCPRPDGMVACHGIRGRTVDSLDNLSWGTQRKNCFEDKLRDGTMANGERNGNSKLNRLQVRIIRHTYCRPNHAINQFNNHEHVSTTYLAKIFNVSIDAIYNIVNNKTWRHV